MSSKYDTYNNPLTGRYAGKEMSRIWSPQYKHSTWRRLWLALAENEKALGLPVTDEQISELSNHLEDIDFERVAEIEKRHEDRYNKLAANVESGEVWVRVGENRWECRNCGHIYIGEKAPEMCPVCKHPRAYFELEAKNY